MKRGTLTKKEFKARVAEEAKEMLSFMKSSGIPLTLSQCKVEAERVFRQEYEIV